MATNSPRIRRLIDAPVDALGSAEFERDLSAFEREYGGRMVHSTDWARAEDRALSSDRGVSMGNGMDAYEEAISERAERNGRWGRDASRDEALAELVNEGEIPMWEERAPLRPRARTGSSADVRDDF